MEDALYAYFTTYEEFKSIFIGLPLPVNESLIGEKLNINSLNFMHAPQKPLRMVTTLRAEVTAKMITQQKAVLPVELSELSPFAYVLSGQILIQSNNLL